MKTSTIRNIKAGTQYRKEISKSLHGYTGSATQIHTRGQDDSVIKSNLPRGMRWTTNTEKPSDGWHFGHKEGSKSLSL